MANPNYLEFFLANTLDLLKLCLECEEFPKYLENVYDNMADFCHDTSKFIKYPDFFGIFYHYKHW